MKIWFIETGKNRGGERCERVPVWLTAKLTTRLSPIHCYQLCEEKLTTALLLAGSLYICVCVYVFLVLKNTFDPAACGRAV